MSKKRVVRKAKKPQFSGVQIESDPPLKTAADLAREKQIETLRTLIQEAAKLPPATVKISHTIAWPRTWWDHVKQDLLPVWVKLRWPVQFEERVYWEEVPDKGSVVSVHATKGLMVGAPISISYEPIGIALENVMQPSTETVKIAL